MSAAPVRLSVRRLALTQFRNHGRLDLTLDARPVCLVGPTGAGKTNILEALSVFAPGRGLRGADLPDMARDGEDGGPWAVALHLDADGEEARLGMGLEGAPGGGWRRVARKDGKNASPGDLSALVRAVWLTPAMDRLFAGPAGERRRFLDRLIAAAAPEHAAPAARYEKALRERQKLLEEASPSARWLDGLEAEIASSGVAIAAARVAAVDGLQAAIDARPDGAFPKADLALEGGLEAGFAAGQDAGAVEDHFLALLREGRARDAAAGRALDGPHRTDLRAIHRPRGQGAEKCSTGEQKALVVGLILAHARRLADTPGAPYPLVLLDEATAHLDPARRAALCAELLELPGQAWLTGVEDSAFAGFGERAQIYAIAPSVAQRIGESHER
jgi:DNA replication and repair protein RecF